MPTNLRVTTLGEIGYAFDDFRHFLLSVQVETRRNTEIKATLLVEILSETKKTNTHTHQQVQKKAINDDQETAIESANATDYVVSNNLTELCVLFFWNFFFFFPKLGGLGFVFVIDDLAYFTFLFSVVFIHTVRHFPSFSRWLSLVSSLFKKSYRERFSLCRSSF